MTDHSDITGRFVRSNDGAWRVALSTTQAGRVQSGDRVMVRRRGKPNQWISIGKQVEVLASSDEVTFEVRRRHAAETPAAKVEPIGDPSPAAMDEPTDADAFAELIEQHTETPREPIKAPIAGSVEAAIQALIQATAPQVAPLDEGKVIALIQQHSKAPTVHVVEIRKPDGEVTKVEGAHKLTAELLTYCAAGVPTMMVGPAGAGKTEAARSVAKALGVPFYFTGAVVDRFALLGFRTATGEVVHTQFSQAIRQRCVFLFDEMDSSAPDAVLAFNAALANRIADLPEGQVQVHPECLFIGAANTYGRGADRLYVGRFQQDAAALDRFAVIDWDYDTDLEHRLGAPAAWVERVHRVRDACAKLKVRHVVSMRAIVQGAALLAQGVPQKRVENAVLWRGLDSDSRSKVERSA